MDDNRYPTGGFPPQTQSRQPGSEANMDPLPTQPDTSSKPTRKLLGKTALITGGDSGIGRAVAIAYANEGANVAIVYLDEHADATKTKQLVEESGGCCLTIDADLTDSTSCNQAIQDTIAHFGELNILVNNCAVQYPKNSLLDISDEQLELTFRTNFYSHVFMTRASLPHLKPGDTILFTSSINAHIGNETLIDYTSTKGAITAFARSMAKSLVSQEIRVNIVAPGPIWTPLIPSSFDQDKVAQFGANTPMGRAGQPSELSSAYVFLASDGASYMTGQTIHINGGDYMSS
ncbi:SDR family oxidoreductase [Geomicrobium sp. JSM 1781026]|uniref:SDR family oxidoreductase n=1 Tax=Geomicrobium sp. JSM 1781026 TaxID=3344580 RepID=UPI0035BF5474